MIFPNCLRSFVYAIACCKRTLGKADHLRADSDASLVQRLDGGLVALARLAEHVLARHAAVLEDQLAGAARANAQLVFLLADGESGETALDQKRRDAPIARRGIDCREHDEEVGFVAVGDPQLAAVQDEVDSPSGRAAVVNANASLPDPASESA